MTDIEYIFQGGKSLNWIVSGIELRISENTEENTGQKIYKYFEILLDVLTILSF